MHYMNYEVDIVQCYNVLLKGWTYENLVNHSKLSNSLPLLRALLTAIEGGKYKFVKLTAVEAKVHLQAYDTKVTSGEIILHMQLPK